MRTVLVEFIHTTNEIDYTKIIAVDKDGNNLITKEPVETVVNIMDLNQIKDSSNKHFVKANNIKTEMSVTGTGPQPTNPMLLIRTYPPTRSWVKN